MDIHDETLPSMFTIDASAIKNACYNETIVSELSYRSLLDTEVDFCLKFKPSSKQCRYHKSEPCRMRWDPKTRKCWHLSDCCCCSPVTFKSRPKYRDSGRSYVNSQLKKKERTCKHQRIGCLVISTSKRCRMAEPSTQNDPANVDGVLNNNERLLATETGSVNTNTGNQGPGTLTDTGSVTTTTFSCTSSQSNENLPIETATNIVGGDGSPGTNTTESFDFDEFLFSVDDPLSFLARDFQ